MELDQQLLGQNVMIVVVWHVALIPDLEQLINGRLPESQIEALNNFP